MLTPSSGTLADYNSSVLGGKSTHARIVFPVQNKTFTDGDIAMDGGLSITQIMNHETDLTMGNAVSSELNVLFLNNGQFSGFDWTEEFHVDFGVDISGTTNWVTVGYFKGKKPERIKRTEMIDFTAYDRMQLFDVLADDFIASLSFPMTMSQIYSALCTHVGITSVSCDEMANAMAMSYTENPFQTGITCRQILAWIAEANCCYARVNASGNVVLSWFTDQTSAYSITGDDYFDIHLDEEDAPAVDSVRISSSEEDTTGFIYPVGGNNVIYQIVDNPLLWELSSANRTTILTDMVTRFTAFGTYTPCVLNAIGNWMVETGDIIEVGYDGNQVMNMPIFSRAIHWNGGCVDGYECTGNAERTEMTPSAKEKYETGGKLSNKYTVQSGVDITDEGVVISGGKMIKVISGGSIDMQANTSFNVESDTFIVQSNNIDISDSGHVAILDRIYQHDSSYVDTIMTLGTHEPLYNFNVRGRIKVEQYNSSRPQSGYYTTVGNENATSIQDKKYNAQIMIGSKVFGGSGSPLVPMISGSCSIIDTSGGSTPIYTSSYGDWYLGNVYIMESIQGDGVANNLTTTTEGKVLDARQAQNLAWSIYIDNNDNTWAKIWNKVSVIPLAKPATIYITSSAMSVFTGGVITSGAWHGTISRTSSSAFSLMLKSSGNIIRACAISGASSSSSGTFTFKTKADDIVKSLSCANGTNTFTIEAGSHIRIDLITTNTARMGTIIVCGNSNGTSVYYKADVGSDVTVSSSGANLIITTNNVIAMYCTVYKGDITAAT